MRSSVVAPHPSSGPNNQNTDYQPQAGVQWNPYPQVPVAPEPPPQLMKPAKRSSTRRWSFAPAEGWLALLLLAVAVYSVVFSIISAHWVDHTFILLWNTVVGLLLGLLVAKIRPLPQPVLHLAACLIGHWLSIWLTSIAYHISWLLLLGTLRTAITNGFGTSMTPDGEMVFLFYLCFLCFFLGYLGSWLTYRAHLPWLVALAYCSIMLVNLNYVKEDLSNSVLVLLGALVLLIARIQLVAQLALWTSEGLYTDRPWLRNIVNLVMRFASLFAVFVLIAGFILPVISEPAAGGTFWDRLDNSWTNVIHGNFSWQDPGSLTLPYQAPTTFFGDQLSITGNVRLPTGEMLSYTGTAVPQYLEGFSYDRFDGHTWTASFSNNSNDYGPNESLPGNSVGKSLAQIATNITITQPPDGSKHYIFGPAEPLQFSVPITVYGGSIPGAWVKQSPLTSGEHYQVISNSTTASAEALSQVPLPQNDLGFWQEDSNYSTLHMYYLQIPIDLSSIVGKTIQEWTQDSTNAYQALQKLVAHLSDQTQFTYSISNPPVPNNVDAVTWLLQTHRGYCTYYATAMTIMARLLGIPARIVNGFSRGNFDAQRHAWVVNGDDAHSWVQAYFPGFGWINFDPTPGYSSGNISSPPPGVTFTPTTPPIKPSPTVTSTPKKTGAHTLPHSNLGSTADPNTPSEAARDNLLVGLTLATLLCSFLVLFAAIGTYWWRKLYANVPFISGMYWRVCRIASWAGLPPLGWQTPYEYSAMLSRNIPSRTAAPLRRLTELFVRERWAPPQQAPHPSEEAELERLQSRLRGVLLRLFLRRFRKR